MNASHMNASRRMSVYDHYDKAVDELVINITTMEENATKDSLKILEKLIQDRIDNYPIIKREILNTVRVAIEYVQRQLSSDEPLFSEKSRLYKEKNVDVDFLTILINDTSCAYNLKLKRFLTQHSTNIYYDALVTICKQDVFLPFGFSKNNYAPAALELLNKFSLENCSVANYCSNRIMLNDELLSDQLVDTINFLENFEFRVMLVKHADISLYSAKSFSECSDLAPDIQEIQTAIYETPQISGVYSANSPESNIDISSCNRIDYLKFGSCRVSIVNQNCLAVAEHLFFKYGEIPTIINVVDSNVCGGSFQEVQICCRSTCSISRDGFPKFGDRYNNEQRCFINGESDSLVFNPKQICFQENAQDLSCSFYFHEIRVAPIDFRKKYLKFGGGDMFYVSFADDEQIKMDSRIKKQFETLIKHGCEYVVMQDFGCRQYRCSPHYVARIYAKYLFEYGNRFKDIVFAIGGVDAEDLDIVDEFKHVFDHWEVGMR